MPDDNNKTAADDNLTVGPPLNDKGSLNPSMAKAKTQSEGSAEDELKAVKDVLGNNPAAANNTDDKVSPPPQKDLPKTPKPVVEETSASFPAVSTESTETPPPFPTEQQSGIPVPPQDESKEDTLQSIQEQPNGPPPPPSSGIPPVVTPPKPKRKFGGKRIVATILGLLFLVGGIGAGVVLVQNNQDIRNRASSCTVGYTGTTGECKNGKTCRTYRFADCSTEVRCDGASCSGSSKRFSPSPTSTPTSGGGGSGISDGQCLTPTGSCKSGNDYFDTSCAVTETRCGTKPSNACNEAGGTCISAPSCNSQGRTIKNGGNGCNAAAGEICCSSSSGPTSNPTGSTSPTTGYCDRSAPDVAPGPNNKYCTDVSEGYSCVTRSGVSGSCKIIDGQLGANTECKCAPGTTASTIPTSTPATSPNPKTPPPGLTAQCLNVEAYDSNWQKLSPTQLSELKAGDKIRLTVGGNTNTGRLDMARFTINGTVRPDVTTATRPENNPTFRAPDATSATFYDEYTIPEGVTSFSVQAELHHSTLGWFGK